MRIDNNYLTLFCVLILILPSCSDTSEDLISSETPPIDNTPEESEEPDNPTTLNLTVTSVGSLPEAVSNNPVVEGFLNNTPYLFSFGGIDASKTLEGIHTRSYRYNTLTNVSESIPDLPDTLGKLGAAASQVNGIIYILGGYYVLSPTSEITSAKMHRYDIASNTFQADGPDIPIPTDDQVQAVYNNRYIYLITGWQNTGNIPNVQIYDTEDNQWLEGTNLPSQDYESFGASGTIIDNTIYYFGGASDIDFSAQGQVRIGIINSNDPTDITWSISTPSLQTKGYRTAATAIYGRPHWIGGSSNTYNFNGIAYDGSGGVAPSQRDLYLNEDGTFSTLIHPQLPMDLRGIARISENVHYIAGGMGANQEVSSTIYKLEWSN